MGNQPIHKLGDPVRRRSDPLGGSGVIVSRIASYPAVIWGVEFPDRDKVEGIADVELKAAPADPADAVRQFNQAARRAMRTPRETAALALGKAVHPKALDRLFEIFPDAVVEVTHGSSPHPHLPDGPHWGDKDRKPVRRFSEVEPRYRWTSVSLSVPGGDLLSNTASFYPPVQFSKRRGIAFAFRNLLKDISQRTNEANRALGVTDAGKSS